MDAEDHRESTVKTPQLFDLEAVNRNDGCDILSDGQQDNSLLILEKEWLESQKNQLDNSNIAMIIDDNDEEDDLKKFDKKSFIRTQKIEINKEEENETKD